MSNQPVVSVLLPLPFRQPRLAALCHQLRRVLGPLGPHELIVVADTPSSRIREDLRNVTAQFPEVRALFTARHMGDSAALAVGIRAAQAERVIILEPQLQVTIEDLPQLLAPMDHGMDLVCAWRWRRQWRGPGWAFSVLFNRLVRLVSQVPIHDLAARTFAVRRRVLQDVPMYGDLHRFLPVFLARNGVPWCEVKVRPHGSQSMAKRPSSYARRFFDLLTLAFLTRFSRRPLHFFGLIGLSSFLIGVAICLQLTIEKFTSDIALSQKPLLLLGVLLIVVGIQIASIGLLGELMIFTQARHVEDYYVRETLE